MQISRHGRGAFSGGAVIGPVLFASFVVLLLVPAFFASAETEVAPSSESVAADAEPTSDPSEISSEKPASITTLPPLIVTGSLFDLIPSSVTLTQKQIEALPSRNGTLTEVLPLLPGIQASDLRSPSDRGGEIEAPEISISGAAFYQNTYRIDGVAIDSKLDPVANNPNDISDMPGQSTEITPSLRLVEKVVVYDHSVPARFGNFTGGVIDVTTRSPGEDPGAAVHLRGTRDNWTKFHVAPEKEESFQDSRSYLQQPEFTKYDAGAEFELRLPGGSGLLALVQTVKSDIRLGYFGGKKSQYRRSDQYFLKWSDAITPRDDLALTFNATPTRNDYFVENARDSDFTLGSDNYLYSLNWVHSTPFAVMTTSAGLGINNTFRSSPTDWRNWQITTSKNWGSLAGIANSREGGFGSLEKDEQTLQLASHWEFQLAETGEIQHRANAGFELSRSDASFSRPAPTYSYTVAVLSPTVNCNGDNSDCVDGEQYFTRRSLYAPGHSNARINQGSIYLEDAATWGRFEVRPGARFSRDDYTDNNNFAPRFASAFDLFGGQSTVFLGGLNRYYGQVLLTDQLRTMQPPMINERRALVAGSPGPWTYFSQVLTVNSTADLKTPYADEISVGLDQALLGGRMQLDYIHRKGYDEIARELSPVQPDGKRYYTFNNNGRSRYEAYRIAWERSWSQGQLLLNLTNADSTASAETYNDQLSENNDQADVDRRVWYNGEPLNKAELPRTDFNRTWTGNFTWLQRFPRGFEFTNVTRYRSGYYALKDTNKNMTLPSGEEVDIYDDVKYPQSWIFDWILAWRAPRVVGVEIKLVAEVLNVFDSKVELSEYDNRYEQGRQIWAGVEGKF